LNQFTTPDFISTTTVFAPDGKHAYNYSYTNTIRAMLDEEQEAELRNPFPAPPSHYTNYTDHNLALLALLKSRTDELQVGSSSDSQNLNVE
jgi:hypothetical protein